MTIIFNAILRIQYFPKPWKPAQIKMLPKPGKDPHQTASYRLISLLPVFSKILEKIIYGRIKTIIEIKKLIPQSKIALYKTIIKPVWTYGIQLRGTASNSNIEILQRFQSKTLRSLIDAPWYVTNEAIHRDLKILTVKEEISKFSNIYNIRINNHQNPLVTQLLDTTDQICRLKRHYPLDLNIRFS